MANELSSPPRPSAIQAGSRHRTLIDLYLTALEWERSHQRRSEDTVRTYRSALVGENGWMKYIEERYIELPAAIDVYNFVSDVRSTRSPATCNLMLSAIKSCYAWLNLQNHYGHIARDVPSYKIRHDGPKAALSAEKVIAVVRNDVPRKRFAHLTTLRDKAVMRLIFGTGIRLVSIARADTSDIELHPDGPFLRHMPKGHQEKDELVAIPANAYRSVERYIEARTAAGLPAGALFVGVHPRLGSRMDVRSLRAIVYRYLDAAGLRKRGKDGKLQQPRVWGPHMLRRSAAVHAIDQLGLEAGQVLMSHASSDQTRRSYAAVKKYQTLGRLAKVMDVPEDEP